MSVNVEEIERRLKEAVNARFPMPQTLDLPDLNAPKSYSEEEMAAQTAAPLTVADVNALLTKLKAEIADNERMREIFDQLDNARRELCHQCGPVFDSANIEPEEYRALHGQEEEEA